MIVVKTSASSRLPPGIISGTDFAKAIASNKTGDLDPEMITFGPYQARYEKLCAKLGCVPQAHFGGKTLNGTDAYNLVTKYEQLLPFWQELLQLDV